MTITQVIADEMLKLNVLKAEIKALGESKKFADQYIQDMLQEYEVKGDIDVYESSVAAKQQEAEQIEMFN